MNKDNGSTRQNINNPHTIPTTLATKDEKTKFKIAPLKSDERKVESGAANELEADNDIVAANKEKNSETITSV